MRVPRALKRLFSTPDRGRKWWEIIIWWELRRIPYNLIVGTLGMIFLLVFALINDLPPVAPPEERSVSFFLVPLFGVLANLCYTGGWIAELLLRAIWREKARDVGPQLLLVGLLMSLVPLPLPAASEFLR